MLEFRAVRDIIRAQAKEMSLFYIPPGRKPEDIDLRVARVSVAIYLLDTLDRMLKIADSRKAEHIYSSVESAMKAVKTFLSPEYFSRSADEIMSSYSSCEPSLKSCAARCGVAVLDLEPAVEGTKTNLASMIDEINASR